MIYSNSLAITKGVNFMCEYCKEEKPIVDYNTEEAKVWIVDGDHLMVEGLVGCDYEEQLIGASTINFCPMCGRNLKDD